MKAYLDQWGQQVYISILLFRLQPVRHIAAMVVQQLDEVID